ncbi:MAG: phosphatidylglycerol lysyltransferase domain-containing protein [Clostridium sp.]|nr:phosphatidylglycerol lysyltransferase domain-containing protein [Clostridium sp.]
MNDTSTISEQTLTFRRAGLDDIPQARQILTAWTPGSRTCDLTVGGIFMWTDYFRYRMAVVGDTLFLCGLNEKDLRTTAFSVPCGRISLAESLGLLRQYCRERGSDCVLSAVPESMIEEIGEVAPIVSIEPLEDWADYLYDIKAMSTFSGKKLSKKRNHVNRFFADNPGAEYEPLDSHNIEGVRCFFDRQHLAPDKSVTADFERLQVLEVLARPEAFGFEGGVLSTPSEGIVAFAMGEVLGDTLYVHIEKMNHEVAGSGETICMMFAREMLAAHPTLRYVNREEDTGDDGLRRAKLSYHPEAILRKFNVTLG